MNEDHLIQLIASANHVIENAKRARVAAERNQSDQLVKVAEDELAFAKREKEKYEQRLSLIRP